MHNDDHWRQAQELQEQAEWLAEQDEKRRARMFLDWVEEVTRVLEQEKEQ